MTKTQKKFFYLSVLILSSAFFVFFLIVYFIGLTSAALTVKLAIWLFLALALGVMTTYGYTLTSSAISDAMTTLRRMSRAENLSNPLIMRLSTEAPGTYHHSMNVSNLAQKAAKSIGADSLLVRVASYYHDLGKLSDPKLFVENQSDNEIPHDETSLWIRTNAKKIISHVEHGVKIAKDAGLAPEIIDIISEHHGTSRALYFFERAKERGLKIRKSDFLYPGPKPQTKESAIIMLADCVEATARAQKDHDKETIKNLVITSIEDKIKEGQLERASLSEIELGLVKDSFIDTLMTIYHQRISYKNNAENRN